MDEEEVLIINEVLENLMQVEVEADVPLRQVFEHVNPFEALGEDQFIRLFRVNKNLAQDIIEELRPFILEGRNYCAIDVTTKILVALLFYAHGSYQKITGNSIFSRLSQSSVSRCIREVTMALVRDEICTRWLKFPQNINELQELRTRFFRKYHFPGVVGCIDCTHIAIVRPNENEHVFVNRKHYHSLNVQLVCDENLKIMNVVNRFPGSSHDAHIWRESNIAQIMEQIYRENNGNHFYFLGDSGYPLRPWLLTPLRNTIPGTPEDRFNNRLKSIRSIIERCNGVLKNRWRCLLKHRVLHYSPERSADIVKACCILHNMCLTNNIPEAEIDNANELDMEPDGVNENNELVIDNNRNLNLLRARELQHQLIHNYFI